MVSWWRGENNAADSADGNQGVLFGNATYGAGKIGQSFTFDGSGDVTNLVRTTGVVAYRGALRAAFTGDHIFVVNVVKLDSYLLSVVPSEMPASWRSLRWS